MNSRSIHQSALGQLRCMTARLLGTILTSLSTPVLAQSVDAAKITRPADAPVYVAADPARLVAEGEELFDSLQLSENGLTCKSCHFKFEQYRKSFKTPYPHSVRMARERTQVERVDAEQMVQLCLIATMDSKPLDWGSRDLAALTAYVLKQQQAFVTTRSVD